jgi:hypothetical protein
MLCAFHYGVGIAYLGSIGYATLEQYMISIVFTRGSPNFANNAKQPFPMSGTGQDERMFKYYTFRGEME